MIDVLSIAETLVTAVDSLLRDLGIQGFDHKRMPNVIEKTTNVTFKQTLTKRINLTLGPLTQHNPELNQKSQDNKEVTCTNYPCMRHGNLKLKQR